MSLNSITVILSGFIDCPARCLLWDELESERVRVEKAY